MGHIATARGLGVEDFHDILALCEGADPHLVAQCLVNIGAAPVATSVRPAPREAVLGLPAADPSRSQWWFTGETIDIVCERAIATTTAHRAGRVLCLGAPTVGHLLAVRGVETVVLDVDEDVVKFVNAALGKPVARVYDAADELPSELVSSAAATIIDPPWYEPLATAFLRRALASLKPGGELLMTLPPRLTRPGVDRFRASLIDDLTKAGHELLGLERGRAAYLVPRFEEVALSDAKGFRGIPWRRADLLHARRGPAVCPPVAAFDKTTVTMFSRSPREFRVFLNGRQSADPSITLEALPAYSKNVSTRAHAKEVPDLWTSEKTGMRVGQLPLVEAALRAWTDPNVRTREDAIKQLSADHPRTAKHVIEELDRHLHLWSRFAAQPPLRTDDQIESAKRASLTSWAAAASPREHVHDGDTFRGAYQRDRDRILWAGSFRKLAHKTQLFPAEHDDQTRQRLTHSIEVMQLASTVGASFGLDQDLIEAGSLAHDIGHTPFGHAGEHALDVLFGQIHPGLGGFNHYEHGVDVVRWLEGPYYASQATSFHGLNLTPEVAECILKHTYCHGGGGVSTETLLRDGKHGALVKSGYCHLEGQAVRIADKISYLLSDLEDGLRIGALSLGDFLGCHFFHRAPLSFRLGTRISPYQSFISQRRTMIKLLMEDVLVATNKRLARTRPEDVRAASCYMVDHSEDMAKDVNEIWHRLQKERLHADRRVQVANLRATRIVSELTLLFAAAPSLVDEAFGLEHARLETTPYVAHYRRRAGEKVLLRPELLRFAPLERLIDFKFDPGQPLEVPVRGLIQAKDFVAGLTDARARSLHDELVGRVA